MVIIVLFIVALSSLFLFLRRYKKNEPFNPPPGPKGLPFIGNLHQYDFSNPHVYLAQLGRIYGPIATLRLGRVPVIVVQSAKIAKEILKTQDSNFCNRPPKIGLQKLSYGGLDIAFSPYNDYSKEVKKISIVHLLGSRRAQSFAPIRRDEISKLIAKISMSCSASKIVNLSELLISYASSNICRIAFGKSYEDDDEGSKFRKMIDEAEVVFVGFSFSDHLPSIGWLDHLNGRSFKLRNAFRDLDAFYERIINDHLDPNYQKSSNQEDLIDVLLHLQKENSSAFDLTMNHVKGILMNIFIAGTNTSSTMAIWSMTELIKKPSAMQRVQQELRNAFENKGYIIEGDLQNLPYFKAVVKETLRLHPAAPLLIPHVGIHKTKVEGCDVLPGTVVFVNAWAIGRDPVSWKDPEIFMPERFLGSCIDYKGNDFEFIPFGAGRRMCPGVNLGVANMELALAQLLYSFDWGLPDGMKEHDIDTDTLPGITMHKKNPLCLVPKLFG